MEENQLYKRFFESAARSDTFSGEELVVSVRDIQRILQDVPAGRSFHIDIRAEIDESGNLVFKSCVPLLPQNNKECTAVWRRHILNTSEVKSRILTLGSKFAKDFALGRSQEITISAEGYRFQENAVRTHKTVFGRIDGLAFLYNQCDWMCPGVPVNISFDWKSMILYINRVDHLDI